MRPTPATGAPARRPPFERRLLRHPRELLGWLLKWPSKRQEKVATSLRFLHEVMGLDRLHYGLWQGEALTLSGLKQAQQRYSERLLSWIPEGTERVLDVGAGVGADALELCRRGFDVEAVSPDPYQQQQFVRLTSLPFHLARFQELETARTYDLILMSESAQYIWLGALFDKVRRLAPRGHLLLADYFQIDRHAAAAKRGGHILTEFRRLAEDFGLVLEREEDVTEQALPTLELAAEWIQRYVDPTLEIAVDTLQQRAPLLHRLGGGWLRRRLGDGAPERKAISPLEFARSKRYLFMLYRIAA